MSVNAVRKQSSDEEVQNIAKALIKSWKKLLGEVSEDEDAALLHPCLNGNDHLHVVLPDGSEEKKEGCPVRSSSNSKDSGSSEKRFVSD